MATVKVAHQILVTMCIFLFKLNIHLRMLNEVALQVSPAVVISPPGRPLAKAQFPLLLTLPPGVLLTLTQPPHGQHLHQVMASLSEVRERGISHGGGGPVPEQCYIMLIQEKKMLCHKPGPFQLLNLPDSVS